MITEERPTEYRKITEERPTEYRMITEERPTEYRMITEERPTEYRMITEERPSEYTLINKYQPEPSQVGTPQPKTKSKIGINFIHSVFCLTTGPKPPPKRFLHIVRSRASSFK